MAKSKVTESTASDMKKNKAPVTEAEFNEHAQPVLVTIGDEKRIAPSRSFSKGSFGWRLNDKVIIMVNGKPVRVQVNMNLTVVGSGKDD